ncbi:hypothetical protein [Cohnella caldifontis]|nr:hypothetical protein [Cohnella sp. YIM B05605]
MADAKSFRYGLARILTSGYSSNTKARFQYMNTQGKIVYQVTHDQVSSLK